MRIELVAVVASLGFSVSACASGPNHEAAAVEVPMYTNAEWAEMNSATSVPSISEIVAENDRASSAAQTFSGSGFEDHPYFGGGVHGLRIGGHGGGSASSFGFTGLGSGGFGGGSFGGGGHSSFSGGGHSSGGGHASSGHSGGGHGGH